MKTYSKSGIRDFISLLEDNILKTKGNARKNYDIYLKFNDEIYTHLGNRLENKLILDIGCGQRFPFTYLLSKNNKVIGIDLDVILLNHSFKNYYTIIKKNGFNRFIKTFIRSILFDRKYYRTLSKLNNCISKQNNFKIIKMDAENLEFRDNTFNFIISIHSFEHIENVEKVIIELKRVLNKGGGFYLAIDFYSKFFGGHKFESNKLWDHLLNKNFSPNVYTNQLRVEEYKRLINKHFENVKFICEENKIAKKLLTPEIRKKLYKFSELELIMNPMIVIGRK